MFVGIAVLDNQPADSLRMLERQPEANGCSVVHHVEYVRLNGQSGQQFVDRLSERGERVFVYRRVRYVALAEAGIVGRDHGISIRQQGDQIAEHVRRRGIAVQ